MFQEQFEELKHTGKLPSPSGLGLRILMLTRSEECSLDEIGSTIQADPALTGRILKLANSVLAGGVQPATNVRDAAVRLGLRSVCSVALGFSLISGNRTGRCSAFDYDAYWSRSLANAVAAQVLSRALGLGKPGEAFTLGLLSWIGRLALACVHPTEYTRVLTSLRADPGLNLTQLERDAFCIQHREVGSAIAADWGLPPLFSEVLLHNELRVPETLEWPEARDYLRLLAVAGRVADVLVGGEEAGARWPAAREFLIGVGYAPQDCQKVYDEIGEEWRDWGKLLRVPADFDLRGHEVEARARVHAAEDLSPKEPVPSLRILLVDDEPTSMAIVSALLKREGHRVTTSSNGHEALTSALQDPPQMVITDWMMPEMDGVELCKRLRRTETGRDLYILILTGQNEEQRIVEAFEAGADDHVAKPVKEKLLLARIRPGIRVIQLQERLQGEVREKDEAHNRLAIATRKFERASMTDALTELPNRRYAMKRLEKEWAATERSQLPLSLIMLDIDHFKQVNDTHGHDVGDEVLKATARVVNKVLRTNDTCARLGGEEFVVICPATPLDGATQLAERIRAAVEAQHVRLKTLDIAVTVSLGVSCTAGGSDSIDALLKGADEAVYQAKRFGRNQVALSSPVQRKKSA